MLAARGSRIAFIENKIDHRQHGIESDRQIGDRGNLKRNARVTDFGFTANDALGDGRRRGKERAGDLFGREATDLAQG